jgi:hypothetical protein
MQTIWNRTWPPELAVYERNQKAVPFAAGEFPKECPNCGGHKIMMVFVTEQGPFQTPNGGKVKYLELDEPIITIETAADGRTYERSRPGPRSGWYTGETHVAHCPVCQTGRMESYVAANCGLDAEGMVISLEDFKAAGPFAGKKPALDCARALMAMNREPAGYVTFLGDYGVGKSHLLKGVVNGFRNLGVMARYSTLADMLGDIREKFGETSGSRAVESVIEDYRRARVLCLDEIDKVNLTGWAKETIFRLFDNRWQESDKLLTVMASNTAPADFPAELGYLRSRINGGVVVEVPGPDVRSIQGKAARRNMQEQTAAVADH